MQLVGRKHEDAVGIRSSAWQCIGTEILPAIEHRTGAHIQTKANYRGK
jgi:hypothetical protein